MNSKYILTLRKRTNSILFELLDNEKCIDTYIQGLSIKKYYEDQQFIKAIEFFNKYYKNSLITFYKEKKIFDIFLHLINNIPEKSGFVIERDNSYYIQIDITYKEHTILNSSNKYIADIQFYFNKLYESI
jgi:hypothetical protein